MVAWCVYVCVCGYVKERESQDLCVCSKNEEMKVEMKESFGITVRCIGSRNGVCVCLCEREKRIYMCACVREKRGFICVCVYWKNEKNKRESASGRQVWGSRVYRQQKLCVVCERGRKTP